MPSWCLVYRLSTCKIELLFIPGRCFALLYHLLEYLNQEIRRKREVGNASIFFSLISAAFLSCSLQVVAHSFSPFMLVVVNSFKNGFPLAEPSPTHNSNFPVSAISSNNSPIAGWHRCNQKLRLCVLIQAIVCFKKTTQDSSFGSKFGHWHKFIGCRREETVFWRLNLTSLTKHDF